jgi:hypothetical protein
MIDVCTTVAGVEDVTDGVVNLEKVLPGHGLVI